MRRNPSSVVGVGLLLAAAIVASSLFWLPSLPPRLVTSIGAVVVLALATFVSEDAACLAAGALVARGEVPFLAATAGCFAGILVGDLGLFIAGRVIGRPIVRRWPLSRVLTSARLERSAAWLEARGERVILASRFLPGLRLPTYVAAGVLGMRTWPYVRAMAVAAAIWTPLLVGGAYLAARWTVVTVPRDGLAGAAFLVVGLLFILHMARVAATRDGRYWVLSRWRRVTRWEFWPPWVLYFPVVSWIAWLAIRHKSLTAFTAANPGMPAGGFVGESKSAILTALANGGAAVAPFTVMGDRTPAASRVCAARRFADEHGLPLVLKPDQGQRGSGVRILRSLSSLEAAVATLIGDHILQAYVAGPEFGLFYARRLHEPAGRVISITTKELPTVVGDGTRTLDELILGDRRAVALLDVYRETNADRLRSVPGRGERVAIAELGTHCRGAIFRDGRFLRTPALERAVDAASRAMNGFSFGRFDVRAESESALQEGRFQVLELNGVTSEPTHIYDPRGSFFSAWRSLACTWTLAFAIGSDHAAAGARVWSLRELLECVRSYRRFTKNTATSPGGAMVRAAAAGAEPAGVNPA